MKTLIRLYHRIKANRANHRASIIRRDLMLYIENELSRERQLRTLADWHTARAQAPAPPVGKGLGALIPGASKCPHPAITFPNLNSRN